MYRVSDRTMRSYREKVRKGQPFKIELKTTDGPVEVYVDSGGRATMRNPESTKFNLSLGWARQIIALIEKNEPLPMPTSIDFTQPVPANLGPAITQVTAQVTVQGEVATSAIEVREVTQQTNTSTPGKKQRAPRVDTRDIPNARKVIEAALSGAAHLRAKRDVLTTLPDKRREWRFTRRHNKAGQYKVKWSEVVALFEPGGEFTCPHSEQSVVLRRQEMLKLTVASGAQREVMLSA